jgi:transposase, IS30 family
MGNQYSALSIEERAQIQWLHEQDVSCWAIAQQLGRSTSTVTRELERNGGARGAYVAHAAQSRSAERRLGGRPRKLGASFDTPLGKRVLDELRHAWSPEQVAGRLRSMHPDEPEMWVSHEAIYRAIYVLARGELKTELIAMLRRRNDKRMPRARGKARSGAITNATSISERPAEVDAREVPGHWEGDLIKGAYNRSAVGVLLERTSRMVLLAKMDGCTADDAFKAFSRRLRTINPDLRKTLTYDRGSEMALHQQLTDKLGIDIYFCDPHSPWQRASNENLNGLLRQFLPKGMDLSTVTHQQLAYIETLLNTRPRAMHKFKTPLEVFNDILAKHHGISDHSTVALQH